MRTKRTLLSALVTVVVVASCALAFYFVAGLGEGEHTGTLGKGTPANYPVNVAFANGMVPGTTEPITFTLEPSTATDIKTLTLTKSTSNPECLASWFTVTTKNGFWKSVLEGTQTTATSIPPGSTNLEGFSAGYELSFTELAGTNQGACEGATITIKAVAAP